MKKLKYLLCLILCSCINEYTPKSIDQMTDILVVEGIITDNETYITLSRSEYIINTDTDKPMHPKYVNNALVFVQCDDGTQMEAEFQYSGRYFIKTCKLKFDRKYRLKIEIEEEDCDGDNLPCPLKTYEYRSEFSYPIATSEIDSVFWMKRNIGEPVTIHVSTQSSIDNSGNVVLYYHWSFLENWEVTPLLPNTKYPNICWNEYKNDEILVGSATKTTSGNLIDNIREIEPSSNRLSELYRIIVKQNAITKQAYEYFSNIKKISKQTGTIFSPIPIGLTGNIVCLTDPNKQVIGFMDVSTTTTKQLYISRDDNLYEPIFREDCQPFTMGELQLKYPGDMIPPIPYGYEVYTILPELYARTVCLECYGTQQKPDDWPH